MSFQTGSIDKNGLARTEDGKLYVTSVGTAAITGGSITGANVPYTLAQTAIPFVHLSSGSVAANGAISGITALPNAYPHAYCYFPANALATTIAAGWHYCTFSTTTAGVAYLDTYSTGVPGIPASPSAVTDGKGAFTGATNDIDGLQVVLPAGALGVNGTIRARLSWSSTNNANAKTGNLRVATTGITPGTAITSQLNVDTEFVISNRGVESAQVCAPNGSGFYGLGNSPSARLYGSVNFAVAQTLKVFFTKATATDNLVCEAALIEIRYKGPT
jgi:hypothetical protein